MVLYLMMSRHRVMVLFLEEIKISNINDEWLLKIYYLYYNH